MGGNEFVGPAVLLDGAVVCAYLRQMEQSYDRTKTKKPRLILRWRGCFAISALLIQMLSSVSATPLPPMVVISAHGADRVRLAWPPIAGANRYAVFNASIEDGVYEQLGATADTQFFASALTALQFFHVTAEDSLLNFHLLVKDFDRNVVDSAKVRIIHGNDSTDYSTTNGWVHANLTYPPGDSVTVRAWRNTPSEWSDSLSSFIRTQRYPVQVGVVDSVQVETYDGLQEGGTNPLEFGIFVFEARGIIILVNGEPKYVLGGFDPAHANQDTIWIGRASLYGDTLSTEDADSIEHVAQEVLTHFPSHTQHRIYKSPLDEIQPLQGPRGPLTRPHLQLYYKRWIECTASLFPAGEIPLKDGALSYLYGNLDPICLRQEMLTNMVTVNPGVSGMMWRSVLSETAAESITGVDDKLIKVWADTRIGEEFLNIYYLAGGY